MYKARSEWWCRALSRVKLSFSLWFTKETGNKGESNIAEEGCVFSGWLHTCTVVRTTYKFSKPVSHRHNIYFNIMSCNQNLKKKKKNQPVTKDTNNPLNEQKNLKKIKYVKLMHHRNIWSARVTILMGSGSIIPSGWQSGMNFFFLLF